MSAMPLSVSFCVPMPQQKRDTAQLGHRIDAALKKRAEDFCVRHPMQPSFVTILEHALRDWLDKHEPELHDRKPRPK